MVSCFFFSSYVHHRHLHSFPTRRSSDLSASAESATRWCSPATARVSASPAFATKSSSMPPKALRRPASTTTSRSEEHTSELQSRQYLVWRLLLEKKNKKQNIDKNKPKQF